MNKFQQVSSLDHQMSLTGAGNPVQVDWGQCPVQEGVGPCIRKGAGSEPCTEDGGVLYKGMGLVYGVGLYNQVE